MDADHTREAYHSNCKTKREALQIGAAIRDKYDSIEIDRVYADAYDEQNLLGFDLVAAWRDGKRVK